MKEALTLLLWTFAFIGAYFTLLTCHANLVDPKGEKERKQRFIQREMSKQFERNKFNMMLRECGKQPYSSPEEILKALDRYPKECTWWPGKEMHVLHPWEQMQKLMAMEMWPESKESGGIWYNEPHVYAG